MLRPPHEGDGSPKLHGGPDGGWSRVDLVSQTHRALTGQSTAPTKVNPSFDCIGIYTHSVFVSIFFLVCGVIEKFTIVVYQNVTSTEVYHCNFTYCYTRTTSRHDRST
jgi:hypothetical protein